MTPVKLPRSPLRSEARPKALEIFHPGVAEDSDDGGARPELFGKAQGCDDIGAGRGAGEESLLAGQTKGHAQRLLGRDAVDRVGHLLAPEGRDEADADPVDLVRTRRIAGKDGGFGGLDGDGAETLVAAAEIFDGAAERGAGADALDEAVDAALGVGPDLVGELAIGRELIGRASCRERV